jgi:hypothetical protein
MSSNSEPCNGERGAVEVHYTVSRDHGRNAVGAESLDDAISNAMRHFEKAHLGVRVESRERSFDSGDRAVALLVLGGFDSGYLDSIWLQALNRFGLGASRVSLAPDGEGRRDIPRVQKSAASSSHYGVGPGDPSGRTPELAAESARRYRSSNCATGNASQTR